MESETPPRDPSHARADLAAADQARERLAARLRLPAGLHPALALAIAIQIGTAAVGIARQTPQGMAVVGAGLVVLLAVTTWALLRFRQINGVRVDGLASQIVLGTYAWGAHQWWSAFRADPAAHAGGASPRVLALLAASACLGLAVLLIVS